AAAEAIGSLLADPDRRAAMADAGRRRAEAEFSYEKLAERLGRSIDAMVT
ncbi:MAG TPA: hypothetical protein DDY35_03855, partial [Acidimicrobiaceae bacterium]|nr:hypothetical protein [Acidimicrobiaceae bacterium]